MSGEISRYLPNGYVDFESIKKLGLAFNWLIGGRGTGKTYGALRSEFLTREKFVFMRRTAKEMKAIKSPILSPAQKIAKDFNFEIEQKTLANVTDCFLWSLDGDDVGVVAALSTFADIRGFDASDIKTFILDEFIPEIHTRRFKGECEAFENCYETINRNRELNGEKPVQFFGLSNSDSLMSPILSGRNLIPIIEKMKKNGEYVYINKQTSTGIFLFDDSEISKKKAQTVLYKSASKKFVDMAIKNNFSELAENNDIQSCNLKNFRPYVAVGEISIFQKKDLGKFYVAPRAKFDFKDEFGESTSEVLRFKLLHPEILNEFVNKNVIFCNASVKFKFLEIYNIM